MLDFDDRTRPTPDSVLAGLDAEQRAVATTVEGPVVVLAGAGTGKTRAITHRIAHAALIGAHDPSRTLAVTFTTRAAGELRARLAALGVTGVQARTFHSAALRQAQHFWPRAYGQELPPVHEARLSLVAEAAGRQGLKPETSLLRDLAGEVSWAKVSNVTPGDYARLAANGGRAVGDLDPATVARVLTTYEQVKNGRGVIDLDDILLCAAALLAEQADIAAEIRQRYRHFTVDEYQDVSPLQHTLVRLWLGEGDDLCVVGDPHQSIHAFAGARPAYLTGFTRDHPNATLVRLTTNYRSTPQVVDLANRVIAGQRDRRPEVVDTGLRACRRAGPEPQFAGAASEADEAAAVAAWLGECWSAGVPWREQAILFRINAQSPAFEAALADAGIPYQVRGAERFFERPEIREALGTLTQRAADRPGGPAVPTVHDVTARLGWSAEPPPGSGRVRERWESLNALVDLAADIAEDDMSLADLVSQLLERSQAQHAPVAQGVTLATMHAAKGLEWDAVAVGGVHEGTVPFALATTAEQLAEERRLLYVALTRARTHLRVSWSGRSVDGRPSRGVSRFLAALIPQQAMAGAASAPRRPQPRAGSQLTRACRVCGASLSSATDRKLGRHEHCASSYDEQVLDRLTRWRADVAAQTSMPAFVVFTDATLVAIAEALPPDERALRALPGVGRAKTEKFGRSVLELISGVRDRASQASAGHPRDDS